VRIVPFAECRAGLRHVAVGAQSPIPGTAALLARAQSGGTLRVSMLGSETNSPFTDGGRELFDCAAQGRIDAFFLGGGQIDGKPARLAVDAGAHMFPTLARWMADAPLGVLKSNGLSTMGFALPAAIASALHEPDRPAVAVTGDGGMMMCLGELATAVERKLDVTVVVLNDAMLSLIDVKQRKQQRPHAGVASRTVDFAAIAQAMGAYGTTVREVSQVQPALAAAARMSGPRLIDVHIDPSGYDAQLDAMRG